MNLKPLELVEYIVLHCAATPPEMDVRLKDIDLWHRQQGWLACGYHIVIARDGTIEFGRPLDKQGAHVKGVNHKSIGVCMAGGINATTRAPEDNFTDAQWASVRFVLLALENLYPKARVVGHYELDARKACPSFNPTDRGLR